MAKVELCPGCKKLGYCLFIKGVDELIEDNKRLPPAINDGGELEALHALSVAIEDARIEARGRECLHVNYNPRFKGKKKL